MPAIEPYRDRRLPDRLLRWIETLRLKLRPVPDFIQSTGSPEGVFGGKRGTRYYRTDGAPGTYLYVKTTDTGLTGWVAYG